jgi:hypothetical protein
LNLHTFLRESTWGYPIIAAIHVLGIAWFGGTILVSALAPELKAVRRAGVALLLVTGAVLFWLQPRQYYDSIAFWIKMLLIVLLLAVRPAGSLAIGLLVAIIFAARAIAFW